MTVTSNYAVIVLNQEPLNKWHHICSFVPVTHIIKRRPKVQDDLILKKFII